MLQLVLIDNVNTFREVVAKETTIREVLESHNTIYQGCALRVNQQGITEADFDRTLGSFEAETVYITCITKTNNA